MFQNSSRRTFAAPLIESLENRTLLSAGTGARVPVVHPHAAATPTTKTSLHVSKRSAVFGQDVTVSVSVKASKHAGTPAGIVEILEDGSPVQVSDGTPLTLTLDAKGRASYTFGSGDLALFVGKHTLAAQFTTSNTLPSSNSKATSVKVSVPKLKTGSDGLQVGTIKRGKGKAAVKAGQTVTVLYTGLLAGSGQIFDYATANHGPGVPPNLQFTVESSPEAVITGFDEGVVGMKVGETRVLVIPSALGYGPNGSPPAIPANANLIFLVTLLSVA